MKKSRKPTLHDVARESGVSIASVSRIINGIQNAMPETERRVRKAIQTLEYKPNSAAKMLAEKKKSIYGPRPRKLHFFTRKFDTTNNIFYQQIVEGCLEVLSDNQVYTKTTYLKSDIGTELKVAADDYINHDGAIFIGEAPSAVVSSYVEHGKPVVVIDDFPRQSGVDWIVPDNAGGMEEIVTRFLQRGHRKFAYAGPASGTVSWKERYRAFLATLAESGILFDPSMRVDCVADLQLAQEEFSGFFRKTTGNMPTAIVCANDIIAAAAVRQAQNDGISVPGQLAISGFDNELSFQMESPKLMTVDFARSMMGREAAYRLMARMRGEEFPGMKIVLPTTIVEGESGGKSSDSE